MTPPRFNKGGSGITPIFREKRLDRYLTSETVYSTLQRKAEKVFVPESYTND